VGFNNNINTGSGKLLPWFQSWILPGARKNSTAGASRPQGNSGDRASLPPDNAQGRPASALEERYTVPVQYAPDINRIGGVAPARTTVAGTGLVDTTIHYRKEDVDAAQNAGTRDVFDPPAIEGMWLEDGTFVSRELSILLGYVDFYPIASNADKNSKPVLKQGDILQRVKAETSADKIKLFSETDLKDWDSFEKAWKEKILAEFVKIGSNGNPVDIVSIIATINQVNTNIGKTPLGEIIYEQNDEETIGFSRIKFTVEFLDDVFSRTEGLDEAKKIAIERTRKNLQALSEKLGTEYAKADKSLFTIFHTVNTIEQEIAFVNNAQKNPGGKVKGENILTTDELFAGYELPNYNVNPETGFQGGARLTFPLIGVIAIDKEGKPITRPDGTFVYVTRAAGHNEQNILLPSKQVKYFELQAITVTGSGLNENFADYKDMYTTIVNLLSPKTQPPTAAVPPEQFARNVAKARALYDALSALTDQRIASETRKTDADPAVAGAVREASARLTKNNADLLGILTKAEEKVSAAAAAATTVDQPYIPAGKTEAEDARIFRELGVITGKLESVRKEMRGLVTSISQNPTLENLTALNQKYTELTANEQGLLKQLEDLKKQYDAVQGEKDPDTGDIIKREKVTQEPNLAATFLRSPEATAGETWSFNFSYDRTTTSTFDTNGALGSAIDAASKANPEKDNVGAYLTQAEVAIRAALESARQRVGVNERLKKGLYDNDTDTIQEELFTENSDGDYVPDQDYINGVVTKAMEPWIGSLKGQVSAEQPFKAGDLRREFPDDSKTLLEKLESPLERVDINITRLDEAALNANILDALIAIETENEDRFRTIYYDEIIKVYAKKTQLADALRMAIRAAAKVVTEDQEFEADRNVALRQGLIEYFSTKITVTPPRGLTDRTLLMIDALTMNYSYEYELSNGETKRDYTPGLLEEYKGFLEKYREITGTEVEGETRLPGMYDIKPWEINALSDKYKKVLELLEYFSDLPGQSGQKPDPVSGVPAAGGQPVLASYTPQSPAAISGPQAILAAETSAGEDGGDSIDTTGVETEAAAFRKALLNKVKIPLESYTKYQDEINIKPEEIEEIFAEIAAEIKARNLREYPNNKTVRDLNKAACAEIISAAAKRAQEKHGIVVQRLETRFPGYENGVRLEDYIAEIERIVDNYEKGGNFVFTTIERNREQMNQSRPENRDIHSPLDTDPARVLNLDSSMRHDFPDAPASPERKPVSEKLNGINELLYKVLCPKVEVPTINDAYFTFDINGEVELGFTRGNKKGPLVVKLGFNLFRLLGEEGPLYDRKDLPLPEYNVWASLAIEKDIAKPWGGILSLYASMGVAIDSESMEYIHKTITKLEAEVGAELDTSASSAVTYTPKVNKVGGTETIQVTDGTVSLGIPSRLPGDTTLRTSGLNVPAAVPDNESKAFSLENNFEIKEPGGTKKETETNLGVTGVAITSDGSIPIPENGGTHNDFFIGVNNNSTKGYFPAIFIGGELAYDPAINQPYSFAPGNDVKISGVVISGLVDKNGTQFDFRTAKKDLVVNVCYRDAGNNVTRVTTNNDIAALGIQIKENPMTHVAYFEITPGTGYQKLFTRTATDPNQPGQERDVPNNDFSIATKNPVPNTTVKFRIGSGAERDGPIIQTDITTYPTTVYAVVRDHKGNIIKVDNNDQIAVATLEKDTATGAVSLIKNSFNHNITVPVPNPGYDLFEIGLAAGAYDTVPVDANDYTIGLYDANNVLLKSLVRTDPNAKYNVSGLGIADGAEATVTAKWQYKDPATGNYIRVDTGEIMSVTVKNNGGKYNNAGTTNPGDVTVPDPNAGHASFEITASGIYAGVPPNYVLALFDETGKELSNARFTRVGSSPDSNVKFDASSLAFNASNHQAKVTAKWIFVDPNSSAERVINQDFMTVTVQRNGSAPNYKYNNVEQTGPHSVTESRSDWLSADKLTIELKDIPQGYSVKYRVGDKVYDQDKFKEALGAIGESTSAAIAVELWKGDSPAIYDSPANSTFRTITVARDKGDLYKVMSVVPEQDKVLTATGYDRFIFKTVVDLKSIDEGAYRDKCSVEYHRYTKNPDGSWTREDTPLSVAKGPLDSEYKLNSGYEFTPNNELKFADGEEFKVVAELWSEDAESGPFKIGDYAEVTGVYKNGLYENVQCTKKESVSAEIVKEEKFDVGALWLELEGTLSIKFKKDFDIRQDDKFKLFWTLNVAFGIEYFISRFITLYGDELPPDARKIIEERFKAELDRQSIGVVGSTEQSITLESEKDKVTVSATVGVKETGEIKKDLDEDSGPVPYWSFTPFLKAMIMTNSLQNDEGKDEYHYFRGVGIGGAIGFNGTGSEINNVSWMAKLEVLFGTLKNTKRDKWGLNISATGIKKDEEKDQLNLGVGGYYRLNPWVTPAGALVAPEIVGNLKVNPADGSINASLGLGLRF
jgi:hypothetical protein